MNLPQDKNGIATLDRAIQSLKAALASEKGPWAETLATVVRGQNAAPTNHLCGPNPDSVAGNNVLQFRLTEQAADDRDHNTDVNDKRAAQLKRDGAYRVEQPVTKFERSFKPRFSDEVHKVAHVEGGRVTDTKGAVHPTKFVHSVPATSANTQLRDQYVRRGSVQIDATSAGSTALRKRRRRDHTQGMRYVGALAPRQLPDEEDWICNRFAGGGAESDISNSELPPSVSREVPTGYP